MLLEALNKPLPEKLRQHIGERCGIGEFNLIHYPDPSGNDDKWLRALPHRPGCTCSKRDMDIYNARCAGAKFTAIAADKGISPARVGQLFDRVIRCKRKSWKVAHTLSDQVIAKYLFEVCGMIATADKVD
jgi:hypothetical protein